MNLLLLNKIPATESTAITTASGEAEWTAEEEVYVNDLDVFVTVMLLEDSPSVLSLGLFCEDVQLLL